MEIGLVYMNARYYVPAIGRFASADTIVPNPGQPQSFNRYAYTLNNPLRYTDPSGHCIFGIDTAVCIAIGAGILKAVDYGWTAYDTWQAGRTLSNPGATRDAKLMAGLTVGLSVLFELVEPDDILSVGLPIDDIGRHALLKGAKEAVEESGNEGLERYLRGQLGEHADNVLGKVEELAGIDVPTWRGGLRSQMGAKPSNMANPQAHHNLPWKFREWFAQPGRGLDVNNPAFGRWVEGTPPGQHQNWTRAYERAWTEWIEANRNASRQEVLDFLQSLLDSGLYP